MSKKQEDLEEEWIHQLDEEYEEDPPKSNGRPQYWTKERCDKIAEEFIQWLRQPHEHLILTKFFTGQHIDYRTIMVMCRRSSKFRQAWKIGKRLQEEHIVEKASSNAMPANFAMFRLKCNHGWVEKADQEKIDLKKKELEIREQLAEKGVGEGHVINVHIDKVEDSNEVPPKEGQESSSVN